MARTGYSDEIRLRAKALWITGQGTDVQIAEHLGIQRAETVGEWRRSEDWDRERQYVQRVTEERVSQAVAETISEMNSRHLKEYQLLQTKAVSALKRLDPQKASEASSMLDFGVKGERLVRGEPTAIHETRALMKTNVEILEVVVADILKVLLEAGKIDKQVAKQFAEIFAEKINRAPFQYVAEGS